MPTILVIEDNPDVHRLLCRIIEAGGCTPLVAHDGAEALARAADAKPDLVLLDIGLPRPPGPPGISGMSGMSGIEVCRRLRADHPRHALPIIMVTAHAFAPDIDAAYAAGADDYVVKPFSPRDLTARIEEALAKANRPVRRPALGLLATIATRAPHGNRLLEREVMPAVRRRSAAG